MGLLTLFVLFFIHVGSRKVHIAGITPHPDEAWMDQTARELTMEGWGFLTSHGCTHLILDRDTKFSAAFRRIFKDAGIEVLRLPARSPNLNGVAERWVVSVRRELLDHVVVINAAHLHRLLRSYIGNYHEDRCHLSLAKDAPNARAVTPRPSPSAKVVALPRVGGLHHRNEWRKERAAA